jgi:hypothetical protein
MKPAFLCLSICGTLFAAAGLRPEQLRCEYRNNPQGIDVAEPQLQFLAQAQEHRRYRAATVRERFLPRVAACAARV